MTKKDFEAFAASIKSINYGFNETPWDDGYRVGLLATVRAFVKVAEASNPRFDRAIFLTACGFDGIVLS